MEPAAFFNQIKFPDSFSDAGIRKAIQGNRDRIFYGGLTRDQFNSAIFLKPIDSWPLGHLVDHRVCMPEDLARQLRAESAHDLQRILARFLCAIDRPEAVSMIASAMNLDLGADAEFLLEISAESPDLFVKLLEGRLCCAKGLISSSKTSAEKAEQALTKMLLYYSILDVQLIAARARAIARFGFGVSSGQAGPAAGGLFGGWQDIIKSIRYANQSLSGKRPQGATPQIFASLESKTAIALAQTGQSEQDVKTLVAKLMSGTIMLAIDQASNIIHRWSETNQQHSKNTEFYSENVKDSKKQSDGSRMFITSLPHGFTVAEQVAYACLRLEKLKYFSRQLLGDESTSKKAFLAMNEERFLSGTGNPSLRLYFVFQSVVVENHHTVVPKTSLVASFENYGNDAFARKSATTIKDVRCRKAKLMGTRYVVHSDMNLPLIGSQSYDILPDFRLKIEPTLPSGPAAEARPKPTHDLPEHRRKHGIEKMPKRSRKAPY